MPRFLWRAIQIQITNLVLPVSRYKIIWTGQLNVALLQRTVRVDPRIKSQTFWMMEVSPSASGSPDFALLDRVHCSAEQTHKVSRKIWAVWEGSLKMNMWLLWYFCHACSWKLPEPWTFLDCGHPSWFASPETYYGTLNTRCWQRWANWGSGWRWYWQGLDWYLIQNICLGV